MKKPYENKNFKDKQFSKQTQKKDFKKPIFNKSKDNI